MFVMKNNRLLCYELCAFHALLLLCFSFNQKIIRCNVVGMPKQTHSDLLTKKYIGIETASACSAHVLYYIKTDFSNQACSERTRLNVS